MKYIIPILAFDLAGLPNCTNHDKHDHKPECRKHEHCNNQSNDKNYITWDSLSLPETPAKIKIGDSKHDYFIEYISSSVHARTNNQTGIRIHKSTNKDVSQFIWKIPVGPDYISESVKFIVRKNESIEIDVQTHDKDKNISKDGDTGFVFIHVVGKIIGN